MKEIAIIVLLILGSLFILFSAIGIVRMPDLYTRLTTTTKANTLGIGSILLALSLTFMNQESVLTRSVMAFLFILISIPVSGHFLARVAYLIGIAKSGRTEKDEMQDQFGAEQHKREGDE